MQRSSNFLTAAINFYLLLQNFGCELLTSKDKVSLM